jgi:crotonobetainyl-CoA:carnitine CoA-transferase CaiB-like acyl-CoA transferase
MATIGMLQGVHVLDLGIWRPAPFATQLLAELGASVTKVEPPGGDPMRVFPTLYETLNARKTIVERDLKDPDARAAVLDMATEVDVVVEGFRPGVTARLGVDYPGAARAPELDRPGVPAGDLAGGAYAAMAICAALVSVARTQRGTFIDVSMADVLFSWAAPETGGELASGDEPGSRFPGYGTFACADGFVTLGVVSEDHFWRALCEVLGIGEAAALDVTARAADGTALLVHQLIAAGVPIAPVLGAREATHLDQFVERGVSRVLGDGRVQLEHPVRFGDS